MKLDIEKLKGLAESAIAEADSFSAYAGGEDVRSRQAFRAAANPAAVLELIGKVESLREVLAATRDARDAKTCRVDELKAENEDGLAVIRTLKAQLNCYIKDAERYRLLRDEKFRPGCLSSDPEKARWLDEYLMCGEKLDAVIDSEIAKEAI